MSSDSAMLVSTRRHAQELVLLVAASTALLWLYPALYLIGASLSVQLAVLAAAGISAFVGARYAAMSRRTTPRPAEDPQWATLLLGDRPLEDPMQDRLGIAPLAKQFARSVLALPSPSGFVLAVCGRWGSGKSTFLNFVRGALLAPENSALAIVIAINPWWFVGSADLPKHFLAQLEAGLRARSDVPRRVAGGIARLAEAISDTPIPYSGFGKALARFFTHEPPSVSATKEQIAKAIQRTGKRVVVILDDLDRLSGDELSEVFSVLKSVADFPNVVYVLALDKTAAKGALERVGGDEYLEKILQTSVDLPIPDKAALRSLLFERLDLLLQGGTPERLFEQKRWVAVFVDGIDPFIERPRDVVRLTNALALTFPAVREEVNPVDFIALETLRVFCAPLYDIVRQNPDAFAGTTERFDARGVDKRNERSIYESWISLLPDADRSGARKLIEFLFPRAKGALSNVSVGSGWLDEWSRKRQVAHPDLYPLYFRLAVPEGGFSFGEIRAALDIAKDQQAFSSLLLKYAETRHRDKTSRFRAFADAVEPHLQDLPPEGSAGVVAALLDLGDQLLITEDEGHGIFEFGNDIRILRLIRAALARRDDATRSEQLRTAIRNSRSIEMPTYSVRLFGQEHARYGGEGVDERERFISVAALDQLVALVKEKLEAAAADRSLLKAPHLARVLHTWIAFAGDERPKAFVDSVIETDEGLVDVLAKFVEYSVVASGAQVTRTPRFSPKWLENLTSQFDKVVIRIRKLQSSKSLTPEQRLAIDTFLGEIDNPPRHPWDA